MRSASWREPSAARLGYGFCQPVDQIPPRDGRVVYDGPSDVLDKRVIHEIYQSQEGDLITDIEG